MNNILKLSSILMLLLLTASGCSSSNTSRAEATNQESEAAATSRLEMVKNRGNVICGVNGQLKGFSLASDSGNYSGLDVDLCRAVAADIFNDPTKIEYRDLMSQERFLAVRSGTVDLLTRNTTWTLSRDTEEEMEFAPTMFFDGQGLLVHKASNINKLEDLRGKSVCLLAGTTHVQNLDDRMKKLKLEYTPVTPEDVESVYKAYEEKKCQAISSDRSQLIARKTEFPSPGEHQVLEEVLSKEPLGPLTINDDSQWFDVVKWVVYAMIQGEELGINSQNVDSFASTEDPAIKRFLGMEGNLGENMGLPNDFAKNIIKHVGNYDEVYQRNIGEPFDLERGINALWTAGGLMYSPPFR